MRSEKLDQLLPALLAAQGELEHAPKSSENPHFRSKYADLPTVLNTAKPALQRHGLVYTHTAEVVDGLQYLNTFLFHAESGQYLQSKTLLRPTKQDPQGYGSAITYARRYDLAAMLGMAQDDDDGNAASKPETAASKKARFTSIKNELLSSTDTDELRTVWQARLAEIAAFKHEDVAFYDDLVAAKERRKKQLDANELDEQMNRAMGE